MLELLAVITAIGMVATLYLTALRAPSAGTVEAAARSLAAEIEAALDQAQAREGEMLLDTGPAREGVGRYVVIAGEVGIGAPPASGGGWTTLGGGVVWGAGGAVTGPLGEASMGGRIPARIRCDADRRCGVPGGTAGVFYLTFSRDEAVASAVVLTADGTVQLYRFQAGSGVWSTLAR